MKKDRTVIRFFITILPIAALLGMGFLIMLRSGKSSEDILSALSKFTHILG